MTVLVIFVAIAVGCKADDTREQQAQALANQFVGMLKPQLMQAMSEGGPAKAIEVCASSAPRIADAINATSDWTVRRVSLHARNPSRATPDLWEREVLRQFDQRQSGGESAENMSFGEIVGGQYRYMQAQAVGPLCLTCHGEKLSATVLDTLQQYYPDDAATGYLPGQVRGAISMSQGL